MEPPLTQMRSSLGVSVRISTAFLEADVAELRSGAQDGTSFGAQDGTSFGCVEICSNRTSVLPSQRTTFEAA